VQHLGVGAVAEVGGPTRAGECVEVVVDLVCADWNGELAAAFAAREVEHHHLSAEAARQRGAQQEFHSRIHGAQNAFRRMRDGDRGGLICHAATVGRNGIGSVANVEDAAPQQTSISK
jgi:hypothetical protein